VARIAGTSFRDWADRESHQMVLLVGHGHGACKVEVYFATVSGMVDRKVWK
jgi:hypothetical protein